jgi:hypothetical protein
VKGIFQRKAFWFILVTLLFATYVYPPFLLLEEGRITVGRKWDWIFTLPTPYEGPEIDWAMLFVEALIAILLAIGISLILFGIKKVLRQIGRFHSKVGKPSLKD